jgi:hypothetical protein
MDLVTRFDGIVRQLINLREPVTPAQLYHRFWKPLFSRNALIVSSWPRRYTQIPSR